MSATAQSVTPGAATAERPKSDFVEISIAELEHGGGTNIRELEAAGLQELADSIRQLGVLEPVIVRRDAKGLLLVAGFRRVAASKIAGLKTVPARILAVDVDAASEVQLVENIQRQELSAIEEARAMKALLERAGLTQEQLGKKIGKSQPYVANRLRLLGLPKEVMGLLEQGKIAASHAEVLLKAPKEAEPIVVAVAREVAKHPTTVTELDRELGWKVKRHLEALAFHRAISASKYPKCPKCGAPAAEYRDYGSAGPWVRCKNGYTSDHQWRLTDGVTQRQVDAQSVARKRKAARSAGGRVPQKSIEPTIDRSESPIVRAWRSPVDLALETLKACNVSTIDVWASGGKRAEVTFRLEDPVPKGLSARRGMGFSLFPVDYSTGERTGILVQRESANDRKQDKKAVEAWLRGIDRIGKSKRQKAVDTGSLLAGELSAVLPRLEKLTDPETLEIVRGAEVRGRGRPKVLQEIDRQLSLNRELGW